MAGLELESKPWWVAALIGAVMAGAAIFFVNSYYLDDIRKNITSAQGELRGLQDKVREGKFAESQLPQFKEQNERLEGDLQRLLRILPNERQVDELIKKIQALTERGLFRVTSFDPGGLVRQEFFSEWPIGVSLQGNFHELARFFDRLSRFSRIVNVDQLTINASNRKGGYTINADFTMKTYVAIEEAKGGAGR